MADLEFPRIIYRGAQDVLGRGPHVADDGSIAGETARCESPDDWAEKQKQGWRLTSHIPEAAPAEPEAPPAKGKK